jgi:hypothetical protein
VTPEHGYSSDVVEMVHEIGGRNLTLTIYAESAAPRRVVIAAVLQPVLVASRDAVAAAVRRV